MLNNETIAHNLIPLVQHHLVGQLRELVKGMTLSQKIEVAQVLLYKASKHLSSPIRLLVPRKGFSDRTRNVFAIAEFLSAETLVELTIEILETPTDENG